MASSRLIVVLVLIAVTCGTCAGSNGSASGARATDRPPICIQLPGERVDSIRWSENGLSFAVLSYIQEAAEGVVRLVSVPDFEQVVVARSGEVVTLAGVTNGSLGVGWVEMDGGQASIVTVSSQDDRRRYDLARPIYSLHEVGGGFLGVDSEGSRSNIVEVADDGDLRPAFNVIGMVESFDATVDESRLVYQSSEGPGTPIKFVLRIDGADEAVVLPPGRLLLNPSLGSDPAFIYYEDHEAMALKRINVDTHEVVTVAADDVSEVAIAGDRVAYTFVDPRRLHSVCVGELMSP